MRSFVALIMGLALALGGPALPVAPAIAGPASPDLMQQLVPLARPGTDAVMGTLNLINAVAEGGDRVLSGNAPDEAWLNQWASGVEAQAAQLQSLADGIKPIPEADIRKLEAQWPGIGPLVRVRSRINLNAAKTARDAVALSREAIVLTRKARTGDVTAMQALSLRLVRGSRLLTQGLIVGGEGFLESVPETEAQWSLTAAQVESMRAAVEVFLYLERVAETGSGDVAAAADRVVGYAAATRRHAKAIPAQVAASQQALRGQTLPDGLGLRASKALETMNASAEVELRIADVLDRVAARMRASPLDPGADSWGLAALDSLQATRLEQQAARVRMLQGQ